MTLPETWEPTCTETTALGAPVAAIVATTAPRSTGAVRYSGPPPLQNAAQPAITRSAESPAAASNSFARAVRIIFPPVDWVRQGGRKLACLQIFTESLQKQETPARGPVTER